MMIAVCLSFILHSIYCQCEQQEVVMVVNRNCLSDIMCLLVALNHERTPKQSMLETTFCLYS